MRIIRVLAFLAMLAVGAWFTFGQWRVAPHQLRADVNRNTTALSALYARVDSLEAVLMEEWR